LQISDAIAPEHEIDHPVTRALGQVRFTQNALPETELIRGELASLRAAIEPLLEEKNRRTRQAIAEALMDKQDLKLSDLGALFVDESPEIKKGTIPFLSLMDLAAPRKK
jgi:hypothetical protein